MPVRRYNKKHSVPGLARIALAAPAIAPAAAVSLMDSCPKGEMIRLLNPYEAKRSELTPAIPMRGLAIPTFTDEPLLVH